MENDSAFEDEFQQAEKLAAEFFSAEKFTSAQIQQHLYRSHLILDPRRICRSLVESFLSETVSEVRIETLDRVFLCHLLSHDQAHLEELAEAYDAADRSITASAPAATLVTDAPTSAATLQCLSRTICRVCGEDGLPRSQGSLLITPLEPGQGNFQILKYKKLRLRIFIKAGTFELGTLFRTKKVIDGDFVIELEVPRIMYLLPDTRAFRVSLPEDSALYAEVSKGYARDAKVTLLNISAEGCAFELTDALQKQFFENDLISVTLYPAHGPRIRVLAVIRHISKVRKRHRSSVFCGVQFNLNSRSTAAAIERLTAEAQRFQIRQLSRLSPLQLFTRKIAGSKVDLT